MRPLVAGSAGRRRGRGVSAEPARPVGRALPAQGRRGREAQNRRSSPSAAPGAAAGDEPQRPLARAGGRLEAATSGTTRTPRSRLTASSSPGRARTSSSRSTRRGTCAGRCARPSPRFPAWTGTRTDTRIAYVSRGALRVVAGDGTGDQLIGRRGSRATGLAARRAARSRLLDRPLGAGLRRRPRVDPAADTRRESRRESSPGRATGGCCSSSPPMRRRSTTSAAASSPRTTLRMRRSTSTRPSCPGPTRSSRSVRRASGVACSPS